MKTQTISNAQASQSDQTPDAQKTNTPSLQYSSNFGVIAGYLPQDAAFLDQWVEDTVEEAKSQTLAAYEPTVAALETLIDADAVVRMYVAEMIEQVPAPYKKITSIEELLQALNYIIQRAPQYNPDPSKGNFFPVSALFVRMMYTPAGLDAMRNAAFNNALANILQAWCAYLDSPASQDVLNEGEFGWLSPSAYQYNDLKEFVIPDQSAPHWGFASFNAYFHREIKAECRPVSDPDNPKVIVSANDGTAYRIASKVKRFDQFWIKSQPYSLSNMLDGEYVDQFVGGDVFQSFLSGADYHRWRAPIDGIIRRAKVVPGLMFSELESMGYDPSAGTLSQAYESSVNTRGLVFIESEDPAISLVCVMPIGITEISSVTISVKEGQTVKKGEELGYFSYGGSSMCLIFQPGTIKKFTIPDPNGNNGSPIEVNAQIALSN